MRASVELGVDDIAVLVLIHQLAVGGGKVQARGAAQRGTAGLDGGVAHDVQVLPLRGGLELVDRSHGDLALYVTLVSIEHSSCQSGGVRVEHAQTFDGGGHSTRFHIVYIGGKLHVLQVRAVGKRIHHDVGSAGGQADGCQLGAVGAQSHRNLMTALCDGDIFDSRAVENILTNIDIVFQNKRLNLGIVERIIAYLRQAANFN